MEQTIVADNAKSGQVDTTTDDSRRLVHLDMRPRSIILATLIATGIGLGFLLLYQLNMIVFLIFVAYSFSTALAPVARLCRNHDVPVFIGVSLIYCLIALFVGGFLWFVAPVITEQLNMLIADLPGHYDTFRNYLQNSSHRLFYLVSTMLPDEPTLPMQQISAAATDDSTDSLTLAGQVVASIGRVLFLSIGVLLLAYYWLVEGEKTIRRLLMRVSSDRRETYREMIAEIDEKIGAYFRGQLLLCVIIGLLSLIAFWSIGVPNAITLAVINGITEAIPMIGPMIGAVPAILMTLTIAPEKSLWVALALLLIQVAENNLLVPKVMDRSVGVHPLTTIFAIAAFGLLFGLVGAILAIPMAAILQILGRRLLKDLFSNSNELDESEVRNHTARNRFSILRLEAEELVDDVRKQVRDREELQSDEEHVEETEDLLEAIAEKLQRYLTKKEQAA